MTFELIQHTCKHHWIQTCNDNFNNGPHLAFKLITTNSIILFAITQQNCCFELQSFFKHDYLANNLNWTRVFNFQSHNPLSMHALSHSCLLFPNSYVRLIIFYNRTWWPFKFTKINPIKTLSSFVAYRQALDMTCPKQIPSYTYKNFRSL